jgi:3-dehydroquinate dehydratase II
MSDERVLVLNGPNLNLLGRREPTIYGTDTLADVGERLENLAVELGCTCDVRQTNYEGQLVDWLQEAWETADGVILNPAALTLTSYAVRDATAAIDGVPDM